MLDIKLVTVPPILIGRRDNILPCPLHLFLSLDSMQPDVPQSSMKTATKPLTLHRLSIALLTTVVLLCACVIVGQQRDIKEFQEVEETYGTIQNDLVDKLNATTSDLKRQKQINAHMERWLKDAARNEKPYFTVRNQGGGNLERIKALAK